MSTSRQESPYPLVTNVTPTTRRVIIVALTVGFFGGLGALSAQESDEEGYQFVSGVIASVGSDRITVRRVASGKPAESYTFVIDSGTRVEGDLRVRARVTVGYRRTERGDIAVRIIVRPEESPPPRKD